MRIPAAVTALVLAGALSGCSEDTQARQLPPIPSATPTPTVAAAPSPPPEALAETPEGAREFVNFYMDVLTRAFQDADAASLRLLSDAGCEGCNNLIGAVEEGASGGKRTSGGTFLVQFAEVPPVENGEVIVELRYTRAAATITDRAGSVISEVPAGAPIDAQMRLKSTGKGWVVLGFRSTPE